MSKFKFANVGDLHLYDREIGATRGYLEESVRNLDKVIELFKERDLSFLILGGDVQHGIPSNLRAMSSWRSRLLELGDLVRGRMVDNGLLDKLKAFDEEGNLIDLNEVSCLFAIKGNHDYNRREDKKRSFTFFDDLVKTNVISVPKKLVIDNIQINLHSFGEYDIIYEKEKGVDFVIGVYHDLILEEGVMVDTYLGKAVSPGKHGFLYGVDIAIFNDIHMPIKPYEVVSVDRESNTAYKTICLTPGSIGRTSFSDSHKRDFANIAEISVEEGDVFYDYVEMPLLPYKELFDYEQVVKVKKRENMFEYFSLEIEKIDMSVRKDARDEIKALELDEDVKDMCLTLLNEVIDDGY